MPVADVFYNSSKSLSARPPPPPFLPLCLPFFSCFLDKFWYCRLSPNHKVLHYGDLEESPQGEVPHDSLQDKCECQVKLLIVLSIQIWVFYKSTVSICAEGMHSPKTHHMGDYNCHDTDWCHVELVLTSALLAVHAQ